MKKIIIIGGGPGGYVAAIRATHLGAEVHLIEEGKLGGTCLNIGCIPTKALLHTGEFYEKAKAGGIPGVKTGDVSLDWPAAQKEKELVTSRLVNGVTGLLKANRIQAHYGTARLISQNTVEVSGEGALTADAVIIAAGSEPVVLNFPGADLPQVIDSTQALSLEQLPKSMVIVGGGVIGVEFGSLYHSLGVKIAVVEMLEEILPPIDRQASSHMHQLLAERGIDLYTRARLLSVKEKGGNVLAEIEYAGETILLECEKVLVAVGRKPRIKNLGLEKLGVQIERGAILTDGNFETSVKGIFAVGDCNGQLMLAHAASAQGEAAVEYILTGKHHYNKNIIPSCVYTKPEIAAVGLTEEQAKQQGIDYQLRHISAQRKRKVDDRRTVLRIY